MKRTFSAFILAFGVFLLGGNFCWSTAGQITLEISTTTRLNRNSLTAHFRLTNRGTDTAGEVSVLGEFLQERQSVYIAERLRPGQSAESEATFDVPADRHGSFPLFITVTYQHDNGITASSVSLAEVHISSPGEKVVRMQTAIGETAGKGMIDIQLASGDPAVGRVTVAAHVPDDLAAEPPEQEVLLQDGRGSARFKVLNVSGNEGSTYTIFFAAEFDHAGRHNLAVASIALPVEDISRQRTKSPEKLTAWLYAALTILAVLLVAGTTVSSRIRRRMRSWTSASHLLDLLVLIAVEVFIFSKFDLATLFTVTTTTGGDTASHYYTLEYLRHTLLPAGRISGWTMGNYAGFPILQFYFPLPFLVMCLLDALMPLQVAFKLVTLLGTALLPLAAFAMLRLIRCPFPGPGLGAVFMLPFLFNPANSMWGGNILSTLAGEFSYSLSMSLSLILIGSLYRGARENSGIIRNAVLVFLVGFSHGYTLLFAEAMSLFLLITPYGFTRRVFYLFRVYALGFCLLAFWLVPLLVFTEYTTSYHLAWTIHSLEEIVPEMLLPVVLAGIGGSLILLPVGIIRYRNSGAEILGQLAYLWFGLAAAIVFYVAAPRIGVVDIRYVPYGQLMLCLAAALSLGWTAHHLLRRRGFNWLLLIVAAAGVMHWTGERIGPVRGWSKWNYEGFEAKRSWPVFAELNAELAGDFQDPRVVYEHSQDHNMFGSSRAFESLPLFAGRATLEGLYMQASLSAPFVFYIQTLISKESSQPFPQYSYTNMDFSRARRYLALFNVSDLILKSGEAKRAIRRSDGYIRNKTIGSYELWRRQENSGGYVEVLQHEPVLYQGSLPWKQAAHRWFTRYEPDDAHLVFNVTGAGQPPDPFNLTSATTDDLPRRQIDTSDCSVRESIGNDEIYLETTCPGKPHLVKVSYHPDWQVDGAGKVYLASPSFMLIYPRQEKVHLFYGPGPWTRLGQALTLAGLLVLLLNIPVPGKAQRTPWSMIAGNLRLPATCCPDVLPDPSPSARRWILAAVLLPVSLLFAAGAYRAYVNEPYRAYNRSIQYKDAGQYERARRGFRNFMQQHPLAGGAQESAYYVGITYYLEKKDAAAINAFEEYLKLYPQGHRAAEVHYHIGLLLLRSGREKEGVDRLRLLLEEYPATVWADYARQRLRRRGAPPAG